MIKKLSLCALSVLATLPIGMTAQAAESDMPLQQVLMFSRHNLRAPLADKSWPQWSVPGGQLTTKGGWKSIWATIPFSGWRSRAW